MRRAQSFLILSMYAVSIFGYGTLELTHFLAHQFKNPLHHHAVHKHRHHGIHDHSVSKLLKPAGTEAQQAMKIVKALYFFSYREFSVALSKNSFRNLSQKFAPTSVQVIDQNFPPPTPPPDWVI